MTVGGGHGFRGDGSGWSAFLYFLAHCSRWMAIEELPYLFPQYSHRTPGCDELTLTGVYDHKLRVLKRKVVGIDVTLKTKNV